MSAAERIMLSLEDGKKILICGNGGSAAMSQHLAAELMVRYKKTRKPLPAISLNADTALLTACANDFGYENIFYRQVMALGMPEDVLLVLTTSGKSPNILKALEAAVRRSMICVALVGPKSIDIPMCHSVLFEGTTAEIQEQHLHWIHDLCEVIDERFT